jgi:hypothetical protein
MAVQPPLVDPRDAAAIREEIHRLARLYTPGWDSRTDVAAGGALIEVFSRLLEGLVQRYNQAPGNSFLAFLNMLNARLLPAQPARVPLTFALSQGATENALIPAGSQASAAPPDNLPQVFETERAIVGTPAKLVGVHTVIPFRVENTLGVPEAQGDQVYDHGVGGRAPAGSSRPAPFTLWGADNPDRQAHVLYLGDGKLFDLQGETDILVTLRASLPGLTPQALVTDLSWEWFNGKAWVPSLVSEFRTSPDFSTTVALAADLASNGKKLKAQVPVGPDARFGAKGIVLIDDEFVPYGTKDGLELKGLTRDRKIGGKAAGKHDRGAVVRLVDFPLEVSIVPLDSQKAEADTTGLQTIQIRLHKLAEAKFARTEVDGIDSFWLRARAPHILSASAAGGRFADLAIDTITVSVATAKDQVLAPDTMFAGDVPIPSDDIFPFGRRPRLLDTFYLASGDAFSKPGVHVAVTLKGIADPTPPAQVCTGAADQTLDPILSWEYWNGKAWLAIPFDAQARNIYLKRGTPDRNSTHPTTEPDADRNASLSFLVPPDMAKIAVNGLDNFWLRARIVSGDYGHEVFCVDPDTNEVKSDPRQIVPPHFSAAKIKYGQPSDQPAQPPEIIQTQNSLTVENQTAAASATGGTFSPFTVLPDTHRGLYLGFDLQPREGPISIFFSLVEQAYAVEHRPRIEWEYFRAPDPTVPDDVGGWARLENPEDDTRSLTQSGALEFIAPADFGPQKLFGKRGFWLRGVDAEDKYVPPPRPAPESTRRAAPAFEALKPDFAPPGGGIAALPIVNGVYVNTAWASQGQTFANQILGSGTGLPRQTFTLPKSPVLSETVWVDELETLSDAERQQLRATAKVLELKDAQDKTIQFRVRWAPVDDLQAAGPRDRVYAIDRAFGQLDFGGGGHGAAPPEGQNNITITFRAGGGEAGNVPAGLVSTLLTTIPLVDSVTNPEAAGGGSNTELVPAALDRLPQFVKNRGRAVMPEDYEALALASSRAVARAKCLPCLDEKGEFATGWVTVIIVPASGDPQPRPSPLLRQTVIADLAGRSPNVLVDPRQFHLQVTGPTYISVTVSAEVYPLTLDLAPLVRRAALNELAAFLHPLTGGYAKKGWDFGQLPCLSDFYHVLENISGVDHVEKLMMTLQAVDDAGAALGEPVGVAENQPFETSMPKYTLVCSGDHQIAALVDRAILDRSKAPR